MAHSQTSLDVKASFRLGSKAGYDVFRMYGILFSTNQIRALKITSEWIHGAAAFTFTGTTNPTSMVTAATTIGNILSILQLISCMFSLS